MCMFSKRQKGKFNDFTYSFSLLSSRLLVAVLRCFEDRLLVCVLFELVLLSSASLSVLSVCNALPLLYVSRITININDTPLTESQTPRRYACKMLYEFCCFHFVARANTQYVTKSKINKHKSSLVFIFSTSKAIDCMK